MAAITMLTKNKTSTKADKAESPRQAGVKGSDANCVVSKGTRVEGDFASTESIRLDGAVTGQLKCDRRLVIGEEGSVQGKVIAADAVIMGRIKGDVVISGTLHLMGSAHIEGDIHTKFLVVEEGAAYIGKCQVDGK